MKGYFAFFFKQSYLTVGNCGLGNDSNERVLCILLSFSIIVASDCFVSYMQDTRWWQVPTPQQRCTRLSSISHKHQLVVFHSNPSDSKLPHVSRNLLSILTILKNVVMMISILPLISNSSIPISKPFGDHSKCTNYNWYHRHLHASQPFSILRLGPNIC